MKKKVGIVIGAQNNSLSSEEDFETLEYNYPGVFKYLDDNSDTLYHYSSEFEDYTASHDAVIFAFLNNIKQNKYSFHSINGDKLTKKELDKYDIVYSIYELGWWYEKHFKNKKKLNEYDLMINDTTAKVVPSPRFQDFILRKHKYMNFLKKNGIPIIPTLNVDVTKYMKSKGNKDTIHKQIKDFAVEHNNTDLLFKTELTGFSKNVETIKNKFLNGNKVDNYLKKVLKYNLTGVLVQPYIKGFDENYEYRLWWLNGKYTRGIGQKLDRSKGYGEPRENLKNQNLNKKILRPCVSVGNKICKLIKEEFNELPPILRIDFGCCIKNSIGKTNYFVNEIEFSPTHYAEDQPISFYADLAHAIFKGIKQPERKTQKKPRK